MSSPIISVRNIGKKYKLGATLGGPRYKTLRDVLTQAAFSLFRKLSAAFRKEPTTGASHSSPNNPITQSPNNQNVLPPAPCPLPPPAEASPHEFWALKDISFDVQQGEVVGIIGRNGAGKSTLLKILSEITEPTEGEIRIRGRVASLLEVGTGFHPELSGRENVYMNGAILGMTKAEIDAKFDEIVAFAGVEKFIDTPVKRYSSGMTVRLAFAVAAHLEPEILLVDEVLAVGDIAFQKKCLGKMRDVVGQGRTVLFVSHNMASISALCSNCMYLEQGCIKDLGTTDEIIRKYLECFKKDIQISLADRTDRKGTGQVRFTNIQVLDAKTKMPFDVIMSGQDVVFMINYKTYDDSLKRLFNVSIGIQIYTAVGTFITALNNYPLKLLFDDLPREGQVYCLVPHFPLMMGTHYVTLVLNSNREMMDLVEQACEIVVETGDFYGTGIQNVFGRQGVFFRQEWGTNLDKLLDAQL